MDKKNGISERFLAYIKHLDTTLGSKVAGPETTLSEKALNTGKAIDNKHGVTKRANTYYEKAFASPIGQKVSMNEALAWMRRDDDRLQRSSPSTRLRASKSMTSTRRLFASRRLTRLPRPAQRPTLLPRMRLSTPLLLTSRLPESNIPRLILKSLVYLNLCISCVQSCLVNSGINHIIFPK